MLNRLRGLPGVTPFAFYTGIVNRVNVRNAVVNFGLFRVLTICTNASETNNLAVLNENWVEAVFCVVPLRFGSPIAELGPCNILLVDFSVRDHFHVSWENEKAYSWVYEKFVP